MMPHGPRVIVKGPQLKNNIEGCLAFIVFRVHLALSSIFDLFRRTQEERVEAEKMPKTAVIVVVGDVGHSPRMNYHALSLAEHGMNVEIVGYNESKPHLRIREHPLIKMIPLKPVPKSLSTWPPAICLVLKTLWVAATLFFALFWQTKWSTSVTMMQNPPGIPGLFVARIVSWLKRSYFVIDWHNYTWSVLQINHKVPTDSLILPRQIDNQDAPVSSFTGDLSCTSMFVALGKETWRFRIIQQVYFWEGVLGRSAHVNICVTKEMKADLLTRWKITNVVTLYDKAPSWNFKELSVEDKHVFFEKLCRLNEFKLFRAEGELPTDEKEILETAVEVTRFSYRDDRGVAHLRESRPLILLSSTSWTEDEDFGILLDALKSVEYVAQISSTTISSPANRLPHLIVVITGKGPQKAMYLDRIDRLKFRHVHIVTPWLEAEDYPKMLAAANLGVSLHTSTSGLDLPMKVVDMFGCKLPVLAKSFAAIHELVVEKDNEPGAYQQASPNGRLFNTPAELKAHILDLITGFPSHAQKLSDLRQNLRRDALLTWEAHWDAVFWPIMQSYGVEPDLTLFSGSGDRLN
ncbi:hypothetical protein L596_024185 [Steinernema carpocapsae]|uniref:Glycosyl transferase family 1 domain-containing protein n=2 Tax=Steinernema carpocapsae TaxID=34508 RepID=A0A4U5MG11_STECR|nr:hypothetical protein L596_024185 [Steinernema carpocapsae]